MFSCASWANRYSLPIRRAGSPVHFSSAPRVAKSTLAAFRIADERLVGLARARVGGAGAADPEQVLDLAPPSSPITGTSRPSAHSMRRSWPDAPRVALDLHALEGGRGLLREARLHHHQALAQADERPGHRVDQHRAGLDAGGAGRAGPELVDVDLAVASDRGRRRSRRPLERSSRPRDERVRPFAVAQVELDVVQHLHRLERLAGGVGRAHRVAAAALGAGERVEQALPGQLLHAVDAELLGLLEVDPRRQAVALAPEEVRGSATRTRGACASWSAGRRRSRGTRACAPSSRGRAAPRPRASPGTRSARHERRERLGERRGRGAGRALLQQHARAGEQEEGDVERDDEPQDALAVRRARQQPRGPAREAPRERERRRPPARPRRRRPGSGGRPQQAGGQHALVGERPAPEGRQEGRQRPRAPPRGGRCPGRRSRRGRPRASGRRPGPP